MAFYSSDTLGEGVAREKRDGEIETERLRGFGGRNGARVKGAENQGLGWVQASFN